MIETVKQVDSFSALREEWNGVARKHGNPLLRHEWLCSAARTLASPGEILNVVVVRRDGGDLVAGAPLVLAGTGPSRSLCFLGRQLYEPTGFVYEDGEALRELVGAVLSSGFPLQLGRLPSEGAEHEEIEKQVGSRWRVIDRPEVTSIWLPVETPWHDFEAGITGSRRERLRRAARRAAQLGPVEYEVVRADSTSLPSLFESLLRAEDASWKAEAGTALSVDARYRSFFRLLTGEMIGDQAILFALMRIGGKLAAAHLAIIDGGKLWSLKLSFDQQFAHCSPGVLLMHETVRHAFEAKLCAVEFLGRSEPWLTIWSDREREYSTMLVYRYNVKSAAHLGSICARYAMRSITSRLQGGAE